MSLLRFAFVILSCFITGLAQAKKINIHYQENPPYGWTHTDNKPIGAMVEVLKKVCKQLNHECIFNGRTSIARSEELMKRGESDVALAVAYSKERAEYMWYPPMLSKVDYTFFTKKGEASKYTKIEDVKGKSVAVHISSATGRDLQRIQKEILGGDLKIIEEATSELPVTKLAHNRYPEGTMIYCTRPICKQLAKLNKVEIEPVNFIGKIQEHGIVFAKKTITEEEFKALSAAIVEAMKTEEIKKVFAEYEIPLNPAVM